MPKPYSLGCSPWLSLALWICAGVGTLYAAPQQHGQGTSPLPPPPISAQLIPETSPAPTFGGQSQIAPPGAPTPGGYFIPQPPTPAPYPSLGVMPDAGQMLESTHSTAEALPPWIHRQDQHEHVEIELWCPTDVSVKINHRRTYQGGSHRRFCSPVESTAYDSDNEALYRFTVEVKRTSRKKVGFELCERVDLQLAAGWRAELYVEEPCAVDKARLQFEVQVFDAGGEQIAETGCNGRPGWRFLPTPVSSTTCPKNDGTVDESEDCRDGKCFLAPSSLIDFHSVDSVNDVSAGVTKQAEPPKNVGTPLSTSNDPAGANAGANAGENAAENAAEEEPQASQPTPAPPRPQANSTGAPPTTKMKLEILPRRMPAQSRAAQVPTRIPTSHGDRRRSTAFRPQVRSISTGSSKAR